MQQKYFKPEMGIKEFETEDIMTGSGGNIEHIEIGGDNPPTPDDGGTICGD